MEVHGGRDYRIAGIVPGPHNMIDDTPKLEAPANKTRASRQLFKGDAWRTAIKLAIASVVVGGVLAFLGVSPVGFWRSVFEGFKGLLSFIGDSAWEIVVNLGTYLFFGALIVVPMWLVMRLLSNKKPG